MDKRTFLKQAALLTIPGLVSAPAVLASGRVSPYRRITGERFSLPALPYAYDALEPYLDRNTMEIHHTMHHQGYTNKLNEAISGAAFENLDIEEILQHTSESDTSIRNNGGGYYNHLLFWKWLSPKGGGTPDGKLSEAIVSRFGSVDQFKADFTGAALSVFGSGWAWLLTDKQGNLSIATTPNQDSPLMRFTDASGIPVLGLDVWEHAYYLRYQNRRADYIAAFWNVVNWEEAGKIYAYYA